MNGLAQHTAAVFERISRLSCLEEYTLVGGTALALQLRHRLSEDLDFCKWKSRKGESVRVDWASIEKELSAVGAVRKNLIDDNHCDFYVEGVKVSFYGNNHLKEPENLKKLPFLNNIKIANVEAIGVMKLEVMTRRKVFRDYYDMYAILNYGIPLAAIAAGAGKYVEHGLKTRDLLAALLNVENIIEDTEFKELQPVYEVSYKEIHQALGQHVRAFVESLRKNNQS